MLHEARMRDALAFGLMRFLGRGVFYVHTRMS
jgi:hypothetical protein